MNRFVLSFTMLFLMVSLGGNLEAQEPMVLTLDRAIDMCFDKSWEVKAGLHRVAEAEGGVISARAGFMPMLSLRGTMTRLSDVPLFQSAYPTVEFDSTLGFWKITGFAETELRMAERDNYAGTATLTIPLFTWGRTLNAYWLARHNLNTSRYESRKVQQDVVFDVTRSFYSILIAREFLRLSEESYAQVERHSKSVARLYREGKVSKLDLLRANVARENMKPQLLAARNGVELAGDGLKVAIGLGLETEVDISGTLTSELVDYELEEIISKARKNRADLSAIKERKKMAAKALAIAQAGNKPIVSLSALYEYKKPSFSFENEWGDDWNATISVSWPLFNGLSTLGESRKAKAQLEQIVMGEKGLEVLIELEAKSAYLALKEAEESITSQENNIEEAEEAYRIAEKQFENGLLSNVEYLDTQLALSQAKLNYVRALGEFNIARAALDRAVGKDY